MPIDASIYGQLQQPQAAPNPLASLAQAYQIKGYQSALDKNDREEARQNRLLQLVQSPDFQKMNASGKSNALQGVGDFENAGKVITSAAAANKDQRSADQTQLEMAIKRHEAMSGAMMGLAQDPSQAQQVISQLVQGGILTPEYGQKVLQGAASSQNPAQFFMQGAQASISAKDQVAQQIQQQGQQITVRGQDLSAETSRRGQDLTRQSAVEGQNVTKRGQDLTNQRALDAQGASGKMTEDQGKATGWLVQAENAFANMKAAGFDEKGNPLPASRPGVADMIANSPLGGGLGNWLRSPDRQKFVQGASSLSESLLRAATGAGVNKDEAKQKIEELTPQWGEDEGTTKQKMAAIPLYIESLKVRAGPGASKAQQVLASQEGGTPPAPTGGVISVTNAADYAKVPSGAIYTTPDGKTRRKP